MLNTEIMMDLTQPSNFFQLAAHSQYLVVDTEGDGRDLKGDPKAKTYGSALTFRMGRKLYYDYFPFRHKIGDNLPAEDLAAFKLLLETYEGWVVVFNAKHDILALENLGIDTTKFKFLDLMLMAHWVNEHELSYTLNYLSKKNGGQPKEMPESMRLTIERYGWEYVDSADMRPYSANDGKIEYELFEKILPQFELQGFLGPIWDVEQDFIRALIKMELPGIKIDKELCKYQIELAEERMDDIVYDLDGLVPTKSTHLEILLHKRLGLPVLKRSPKTGKPSFDKEVMKKYDEEYLQLMGSPVAKMIREYRGWTKTKATNYEAYLRFVSADGRLRPNYMLHRAKTTRLSSGSDTDGKTPVKAPNMQNIPKLSENRWDGRLKEVFIPEDGYRLWEHDYSQLEFRITACYSKDPTLIKVFNTPGADLFTTMSNEMGHARPKVKETVYSVNYGIGVDLLSRRLGVSEYEAAEIKDSLKHTYPKIDELMKETISTFVNRGDIRLWTGRRCHYTGYKKYAAFNYLIQGGGAEIVKRAIIRLAKEIDWDTCKMLLQVHDSLVFEIKIGYEDYWNPIIKRIMEDVPKQFRAVPFNVECKEWGTAA